MSAIAVFAVAALATLVIRSSMIVMPLGSRLSATMITRLELVAPAMLGAMTAGALLTTGGGPTLAPTAELVAVVTAVVAVRRTGSLHAAFVVGFPVFWLISAF